MTAYQPAEWHDLFGAVLGAAAALLGLIFVAVSINIKQIIAEKHLPSLAGQSITLLFSLMLICMVTLAPGQPRLSLGIELSIIGVVVTGVMLIVVLRRHGAEFLMKWTIQNLLLALVSTVPLVIGGISLVVGAGGGLYWVLIELVCAFAISIYYAWILLIEILR
ncbi:hypothetical protein [uncultured Amnibacterium sp.]|uniref:hypothetical protein n=1 Tax=uncultured Amnibacterium sp. TaxID=1631851 RepID=UPI0035CA224E